MAVVLYGRRFRCDGCGTELDENGPGPEALSVQFAAPAGWRDLGGVIMCRCGRAIMHLCPECLTKPIYKLIDAMDWNGEAKTCNHPVFKPAGDS